VTFDCRLSLLLKGRCRVGQAKLKRIAAELATQHGGDVSAGLVLNFLAAPEAVLTSLRHRLRPGGTVSACVWDYAAGMEFLRAFWDEATAVDGGAADLDEGRRFPLCSTTALRALFDAAGLTQVDTGAILGTGSPVSGVPYVGIRRVSVVRLITDIDPLETIPAPAGAVVASCCGER